MEQKPTVFYIYFVKSMLNIFISRLHEFLFIEVIKARTVNP